MNKKISIGNIYTSMLTTFTYTVLVTSVFRAIFSGGTLTTALVWQIAGVSAAIALLQAVFFTARFIRRATYPLRITGFLFCLFAVLSLFAWLGGWFSVYILSHWLLFTGAFFLIATTLTVSFALYYSRKAGAYTQKLQEYQNGLDGSGE